ncbi:protein TIPIN homolog [Zeugodacus cucurbitae]|uniref:protein TIPIN homolog n=1 Tax=Zeugodacus cucurbitae TaxID=28588 RepID=UPI0005968399|nr:protein TIPIN homolog [Zeugodacus cucurbitae]XP_054082283.1 protein TIPIN homolog [Zeugodacus cucurbitae]XP_054082284.1 protein TIPIN homolog [Zeugodacus cucurbitae]XP_054082285.1 protein TIPIN homolog [Zeugodacus cucurbitae]XP_054082286.1 protein TIPIN homolog [Zeugodacus cucurbitae]
MSSVYGDDVVEDLISGNLHDLPSDEENDQNGMGGEELFGEDVEAGDNADGAQQGIKVEPKKRTVRNPRPKLSLDTLTGQRGIHTIEEYFKDVSFKGKGHEKRDLDEVMRRMTHWAHRMYPNYKFDDVLTNIERIGKKKSLQVHMSRYRLGMLDNLKTTGDHVQDDEDDGDADAAADEPFDEFDALLGEQIAISKIAPRTPAHYSSGGGGADRIDATFTGASTSTLATPSFNRGKAAMSTPYTNSERGGYKLNDSDLAKPLPPSQPASPAPTTKLTAEQMARIAENRRIALERLKAKKERLAQQTNASIGLTNTIPEE